MSNSDSDDDLRPHERTRRHYANAFFSDSDDEPELRDYESDDGSIGSSLCSGSRDGIPNGIDDSSTSPDDDSTSARPSNQGGRNGLIVVEVPADLPPEERADLGNIPPPRAGRSIADHLMNNKEFCMLSFDIEHGGEYCGIVQLSAEFCRMKLQEKKKSTTKDSLDDWSRHTDTFNAYVNPGDRAIWGDAMTAVHGLRRTDTRIINAPPLREVWNNFVAWFNDLSREFAAVILVAWNGETCDLKWLWKICQSPNSPCLLPAKLQYFMDPYKVVKNYTSCQINPTKSKIDCLSLGSIYKFLFEEDLEGAHDSLTDCIGQTSIVLHELFVPFINRKQSIDSIDKIFKAKDVAEWKRKMEPVHPVHDPWIELTEDFNVEWEPSWTDSYNGANGGPKAGPTQHIMDIARGANSLADVFFGILPLTFFQHVSKMTDKYCYLDWVVEKEQLDSDGNVKKKKVLKQCTADTCQQRR
jgi:hypothetical protein